MVNNAGVETRTSILDTTEAQYERVLEINLKSAFFGTQLAAKQMIAQGGGGRIINITSVHEDWPMPGNTAYCLSKGGMRMLTRTAGVELGAARHPGRRRRPGCGRHADQHRRPMDDPAKMKTLDAAIPLGRMAQPEEIASVVAFLAGDGRQLPHGHDDLRRRRHHALQPGALSDGRRRSACDTIGGRRRRRLRRRGAARRRSPRHGVPRHAGRPARLPPVPAAAVPGRDRAGRGRATSPGRSAASSARTRRST